MEERRIERRAASMLKRNYTTKPHPHIMVADHLKYFQNKNIIITEAGNPRLMSFAFVCTSIVVPDSDFNKL
jgi:5,10-methylene-tetrahydrofolate dehydrogenase/methenyl tetrahydrofolate cyclohydrolase